MTLPSYLSVIATLLLVGACAPTVPLPPVPKTASEQPAPSIKPGDMRAKARSFARVVDRVEPVAEQFCAAQLPGQQCDFLIVVDDRPGVPPNAFQTVDRQGRPVIGFTLAMIANVSNEDEIAFVLSHEAAHHILQHLHKKQGAAEIGASVIGGLVGRTGASAEAVRLAQQFGAAVGARSYSKEFELEADALGTRIAQRAGFNPVRGAAFFDRIPDPGDRFLGTHPPNKERIATVRRVAAGL